MPALPPLLVLLTAEEIAEFFPGDSWVALQALSPRLTVLDPSPLAPVELVRQLEQLQPAVLVAGWSTRSLPPPLPRSLVYLCYLTGSVRHLVSRDQIAAGLLVTNWGSSISRTVAEAALLHLLAALRRLPQRLLDMHVDRAWRPEGAVPQSLFGRRVGIHGFGRVARELIALLQPFGCRLMVAAPDVTANDERALHVQRAPSLEALFGENDIVVELAPLNPETRGVVTESLLRRIPRGGVFVNVGRGAVVDEEALARVAREGDLQIALDVYATEPLPADSPLRGLRNVTLTPHVAGPTPDRRRDAGDFALRNLRAFAAGAPLEAVITAEVYDVAT